MENKKIIEGSAAITKKDYRVLAYFNVFKRHPAEPYILGAMAILASSVIVGYFLPWFHPEEPLLRLSYIFWIILALVLMATEYMALQYLKKEGDQTLGKEFCYRFTENALEMKDAEEVVSIEWKGFFKGIELRHHFLLFFTINHALIVPKRAFSAEDCVAIRKQLQSKLGSNFILRCKR